jgi:hypothetical protein
VPAAALAVAGAAENPFGVMLPSRLVRSKEGIQLARELGAVYLRPDSVFLEGRPAVCGVCDAARSRGLRLVLTVRNNGPQATTPPADLESYQRAVAAVLDQYRPAILVVENEENSALFYRGTPEAYASQLKAACEAAHRKGIRCTNGGLVSALAAYLQARSGLPVMTNEVGQFTDDPDQTQAVMGKIVELGLPVAVWFGLDGPRARGLVEPDGRLRPTGEAFQRFIRRTFSRR